MLLAAKHEVDQRGLLFQITQRACGIGIDEAAIGVLPGGTHALQAKSLEFLAGL
jgi:hypothetical protein